MHSSVRRLLAAGRSYSPELYRFLESIAQQQQQQQQRALNHIFSNWKRHPAYRIHYKTAKIIPSPLRVCVYKQAATLNHFITEYFKQSSALINDLLINVFWALLLIKANARISWRKFTVKNSCISTRIMQQAANARGGAPPCKINLISPRARHRL